MSHHTSHTPSFDRRALLRASAIAGAGLGLSSWLRSFSGESVAHAAAAKRTYGGLPMGIQSYSLRAFDFDTTVEKVKALGLKHIEFYGAHFPMDLPLDDVRKRQATLKAAGITWSAYGVQGFGKDHAKNRKQFEFAKLVGLKNISANPQKNQETFDSLEKLVKEFGVNIAIHNHGPGADYDKLEDVLEWTKGRDKRIGACADLGHYIRSGVDPLDVLTKLKDRLHGVHLKDFKEAKKDAAGCILGEGLLKVKPVMQALVKMKFRGVLSLEYEEKKDDPIADIEKCLDIAHAGTTK